MTNDVDDLDVFEEEAEYKIIKIGSYGRFASNASFPIDYLLTTFGADELDELTLARDIRPDKLDFELLMQRDIDEERVMDEIEPYLNPDRSEKLHIEQIIFFPPILAAIVPVKANIMQSYYAADKTVVTDKRAIRTMEGHFKLTFNVASGPSAYKLEVQDPDLGNEIQISKKTAKIELREAKGSSLGVKLVVIDGQHRLKALQELSKKQPDAIEQLVLPVCILFPSNSNERYASEQPLGNTPTIHEVFRKLFVDVNKTAVTVGGHFNILLSDSDIGNLICRSFCAALDNERLSVVEWNTKSSKDSTIIKRDYSITSIGVLDQALDECFGNKKELPKYLLDLNANDFENLEELQDISWRSFTVDQKSIIVEKINKNVAPLLIEIFFTTKEFNKAFEAFTREIDKYKKARDEGGIDYHDYKSALESITEYKPTNNNDAKKLIQTFNNNVKAAKEHYCAQVIGYAIFQRALIDAWVRVLFYGMKCSLSPRIMTDVFVMLLNKALEDKGEYFSTKKSFMLHSVFSINGNINPTKKTKDALSNALFAHFGDKDFAKQVADTLQLEEEQRTRFVDEIQKDGISSADAFLKHYEVNRRKTFTKTYSVDFDMSAEEKTRLSDAEDLYKRHLAEVKDKKRDSKDITQEFDRLVERYVEEDLHRAYNDMSAVLNYDEEILNYSSAFQDEQEDE